MNVRTTGRAGIPWATQSVCTAAWNGNDGCGAVLEVGESDLFLREYPAETDPRADFGDQTQVHPTYRCPLCHKETAITNVPQEVRERLRKREG